MIINLNINTSSLNQNYKRHNGSNNNYYNRSEQPSFGSIRIKKGLDEFTKKMVNYAESATGKLSTKAGEKIDKLKPIEINKNQSLEEISSEYEKKRQDIREDIFIFRKKRQIEKTNIKESKEKEKFLEQKAHDVERNQMHADETEKIVKKLISDTAHEDPEVGIMRRAASEASNLKKASFDQLKGFDKIAGYIEEKTILQKYFTEPIQDEKLGKNPYIPGSILFFGPTGNGKSTFAKAFADVANCGAIVEIDRYGFNKAEKERNFMQSLLDAAEESKNKFTKTRERTIIFIDEFDSIADETSVILDDLEKFFATCSEDYHCTIFACTNEPEKIFKAGNKKGIDPNIKTNFPCRVALNPPDKTHSKMIFEHYLNGRTSGDIDYETLTEGLEIKAQEKGGIFSNSQIRQLCLGENAAKLENDEDAFKNSKKDISQEYMLRLINSKETLPAISTKDLAQFYKEEDAFIGS